MSLAFPIAVNNSPVKKDEESPTGELLLLFAPLLSLCTYKDGGSTRLTLERSSPPPFFYIYVHTINHSFTGPTGGSMRRDVTSFGHTYTSLSQTYIPIARWRRREASSLFAWLPVIAFVSIPSLVTLLPLPALPPTSTSHR